MTLRKWKSLNSLPPIASKWQRIGDISGRGRISGHPAIRRRTADIRLRARWRIRGYTRGYPSSVIRHPAGPPRLGAEPRISGLAWGRMADTRIPLADIRHPSSVIRLGLCAWVLIPHPSSAIPIRLDVCAWVLIRHPPSPSGWTSAPGCSSGIRHPPSGLNR